MYLHHVKAICNGSIPVSKVERIVLVSRNYYTNGMKGNGLILSLFTKNRNSEEYVKERFAIGSLFGIDYGTDDKFSA